MNKYRNEIEIALGQNKYTLRATFNAIVSIEEKLGFSLPEVLGSVENMQFKAKDLYTILSYGIEGYGDEVNEEQLQTDIIETGLTETAHYALAFIIAALTGNKKPTPPKKK